MKSKFLIKIYLDEKCKWKAICASAKVQVESISKEKALIEINKELAHFIKNEADKYLSRWKRGQNVVNCPEGYVLLPLDIWKCKLDGETCPTQGQVFLDRQNEFKQHCRANEDKKEKILELIQKGDYDGFHHIIGRGICVLCKGKEYFKYHYPWELNYLSDYMDIYDRDLRIKFIKSGINQSTYFSSLCPDCFIRVVSELEIDAAGAFERLDLDFYR